MAEVPKYKILKKLEAGGMAEVFCAEIESIEGFKKQVAIKRVLPHLSQQREFIAMFLDEARLSLKFNHANVVQTFDIGVAENTYFITMEYVDGLNLKKILDFHEKRGLFIDPFYASYIINEACKGLAYAHGLKDSNRRPLGVVHRDVSPPNVLISRQGEVKLVDFGLAKATSQLEHTEPGIIKGKFSYLSPEAAWGKNVDYRTDIFCAGILFWEMMAGGRKLFQGSNDYETVNMIREARVPSIRSINKEVPEEFEHVAIKALQADPVKRYQSAAEMGRDITKVMFSLGKAVSNFDIATLIEKILEEEPPEIQREPDVIDHLIEEELQKITSIDSILSLRSPDIIFSEGSRPISLTEASGLINPPGLTDPREWAQDIESESVPESSGRLIFGQAASGWKESKVLDLGPPVEKGGKQAEDRLKPEFPVDLRPERRDEKMGPGYTLWFILIFLALMGIGAAFYFFLFGK